MAAIIERDIEAESEAAPLSHRRIFRFYMPLALSWLFMAVEGPSCTAILGRLPEKEVNTAAFQVLMAIALWLESPIIDLLSTSTTLCRSPQSFGQLSKFVGYLLAWVTAAHLLLVFTPLYWFVTLRVLSLPHNIAETARPSLMIMLPWAPVIGWRRYLQGILIRADKTRLVGIGTFVRVATMSVVGWSLFATHSRNGLPGTDIAAIALICAVVAEAAFEHAASRPTVNQKFKAREGSGHSTVESAKESEVQIESETQNPKSEILPESPLTMRKLFSFHLPLSATTMVMFASSLVISAALSKSSPALAVLGLASWQVSGTLMWLCRTIVFALPEVIITLYKDETTARKLRDFSIRVGLITSACMVLTGLLGGDELFFRFVLGENDQTVGMAHLAFLATMGVPMIAALQSYVRGMLTAHHLTVARFVSVLASITTLSLMLILGLVLHWVGVLNAAAALTVAMLAELLVLSLNLRRHARIA